MAEPVLPSTGGDPLAGFQGSVIAQEMRQARADLGAHVKACRYCLEFTALCPAAVKLFILWRGKPPAEDFILGGAAWLDGKPGNLSPELARELEPGPAWQAVKGATPSPTPLRAETGWKLLRAFPHQFGPGKTHYLIGEKDQDGAALTLCSHRVLGTIFDGRPSDVTCQNCTAKTARHRGRPLRGEQLGLDLG